MDFGGAGGANQEIQGDAGAADPDRRQGGAD